MTIPVSKNTFFFIGLKRSGQHAILEWIANHYNEPVYLTNNCVSWPPKTWKCTHVFHVRKHDVKDLREDEKRLGPSRNIVNPRLVTIEDPFKKYRFDDLKIGVHKFQRHIACIRSFWNNAASRLWLEDRHSAGWDQRFPDWWSELAESCYEEPEGWVFVKYDVWNGDMDYRTKLAKQLKIFDERLHASANERSKTTAHKGYGGNIGSSFHKWNDRQDPNARWKRGLEDKRFKELVASSDIDYIRDANFDLFGWTLDRKGNYICDVV